MRVCVCFCVNGSGRVVGRKAASRDEERWTNSDINDFKVSKSWAVSLSIPGRHHPRLYRLHSRGPCHITGVIQFLHWVSKDFEKSLCFVFITNKVNITYVRYLTYFAIDCYHNSVRYIANLHKNELFKSGIRSVSEIVSGVAAETDTATSSTARAGCSHRRSGALYRRTSRQSHWSPTTATQSWRTETTHDAVDVTCEKIRTTHQPGHSCPKHVAVYTPGGAAEKSCRPEKIRNRAATNAAQMTRIFRIWVVTFNFNDECSLSLPAFLFFLLCLCIWGCTGYPYA